MSIYPLAAIDSDICFSVREKQRSHKGFGSVVVYNNTTREMVMYRYAMKHAFEVLQYTIRDMTLQTRGQKRQLHLLSDFSSEVTATIFSVERSGVRGDLHYVDVLRGQIPHRYTVKY
jgi:hypothetical protein